MDEKECVNSGGHRWKFVGVDTKSTKYIKKCTRCNKKEYVDSFVESDLGTDMDFSDIDTTILYNILYSGFYVEVIK